MSKGVCQHAALPGNEPCAARWAYAVAFKTSSDFVNMTKHALRVVRERQGDGCLVQAIHLACALDAWLTTSLRATPPK